MIILFIVILVIAMGIVFSAGFWAGTHSERARSRKENDDTRKDT